MADGTLVSGGDDGTIRVWRLGQASNVWLADAAADAVAARGTVTGVLASREGHVRGATVVLKLHAVVL
jgi:WD40 repeat protein